MSRGITPKKYVSLIEGHERVIVHQYPDRDSERNIASLMLTPPGTERQHMAIQDNKHLGRLRKLLGLNRQIVVQTGENKQTVAMQYGTERLNEPLAPVKPTLAETGSYGHRHLLR